MISIPLFEYFSLNQIAYCEMVYGPRLHLQSNLVILKLYGQLEKLQTVNKTNFHRNL